ncbi:hypothetical protein Golob_013344 [Gossypium lobatum]|uniref:Uncharacterized protein n=2 Tax=Gossypium TaxID=3633 RepID=A0A7J8LP75_9ROSI|nr:hypothetical protein [Gossypium lobatum]
MEANTSEELAAQEAIAWLKEMSFDMVIIKMDCSRIVELCNSLTNKIEFL